jgi:hypothetical protein
MSPEKIKKYLEQKERVLFYYNQTSCSISQIARHFDISFGKVSKMITGDDPKSVKNHLKERKQSCHEETEQVR